MEELHERLRSILSLSKNEAKIYSQILNAPKLSIKELSSKSNIPVSRVYETLNALAAKNLVTKKPHSSDYNVIAPQSAVDELIQNEKNLHTQKVTGMKEISNYLQRIWETSVSETPGVGIEFIPFESIEPFFHKSLENLSSKLLIAASESTPTVDWRKAANILGKHTNKGIEIKYLVNIASLKSRLEKSFASTPPFSKLNIQIQYSAELSSSFVIADNQLFLFFFGLTKGETMVLVTASSSLCKTFEWTFRRLWSENS